MDRTAALEQHLITALRRNAELEGKLVATAEEIAYLHRQLAKTSATSARSPIN